MQVMAFKYSKSVNRVCRRCFLSRDRKRGYNVRFRIAKPSDTVRCAIFCIVISILFLAM